MIGNRIAAALITAGISAGCGSAGASLHDDATRPSPPSHTAPHRSIRPIAAQPFRWLITTRGHQPSIASENRHRGTRAWRLPGPSLYVGGLAHGSVTGYVATPAIAPGGTQRIYVSAPGSRWVRIRIFRIGWYGGAGGREVLVSTPLRVITQPPCSHNFRTGLTECDWHPTLSFRFPPRSPPASTSSSSRPARAPRDCLFVVLAAPAAPLAQLPTSTYEAYNAWGGDSLYPGGSDGSAITGSTQGVEVSYDRPYDTDTGAGQFFAATWRWSGSSSATATRSPTPRPSRWTRIPPSFAATGR